MTDFGLMPIGSFAQRSGLTTSALRFYADAGLLLPAEVDPVSGYRFYAEDQLERAALLRRLREIGMPLATARSVLTADPAEAIHLLDDHVDAVVSSAATARQQAAVIRSTLTDNPATTVGTISGAALGAAIAQVLTATADEPDLPVLGGVRFEADAGTLVVTATDRYRLSTRTLVNDGAAALAWSATVNGADLRDCLTDLRRTPRVRIDATDREMWLRLPNRDDRACRMMTEPFPDYRSMLDALVPATTRAEADKAVLLHALEEHRADMVRLRVDESGITLHDTTFQTDTALPAQVSGSAMEVWFAMTTLYPAISTALGADVLIDLRGPDQPASIRSADNGDLTTLAMPVLP